MKTRFSTIAWLAAACAVLAASVAGNPPRGVPWRMFFSDPAPLSAKLAYLAGTYLWPALLAYAAIVLFQLQFRMTMSGARAALVFALGVVGATAMLVSFRRLATAPHAFPGYVLGMALGYTTMARLYAVRMRTLRGRLRLPWIVWRGNAAAVKETDRCVAQARARPAAPSPEDLPERVIHTKS